MQKKDYQCPLCKSVISKERWIKIIGDWEEKQKKIDSSEKKIKEFEKQKVELDRKHRIEMKRIAKKAVELGIKKGTEKESARANKMSNLIRKRTKALRFSNKKIEELERQLAKGQTPQTAGFDYEKEVLALLVENFPEDEIQQTGKKGDVIHLVKSSQQNIGVILYECKKTSKYSNTFVKEIKRHQENVHADFAVIVTHATKEGKSNFFVDEEIIVIDPLGLLDLAFLLRSSIVEMHNLKLTNDQLKAKGQEILKYMQSGEFKAYMMDAMTKAEDAYKIMINEIRSHKQNWEGRYKLYFAIHNDIQRVRLEIGQIITGNKNLLSGLKQLPEPEI